MNQGVEILLARMDSNPEEFTTARGKWDWIMDGVNRRVAGKDKDVLAYLTDEETRALYDKMQVLARDGFTRNVIATLLPEEEEPSISSTISRADLLKELTPGLEKMFGVEYDRYKKTVGYDEAPKPRKIKLNRSQTELIRKLGEQQ